MVSDPTDPKNFGNITDRYFLFFYTLEAGLKILSFTFISAEDAYLKDYLNILDFVVIIMGWVSFILELLFKYADSSALTGLRAVRILRPFRVIKKIKGLKKLATTLIASVGHLGEITMLLFFSLYYLLLQEGNYGKEIL